MANIKSQKKRNRQNERQRQHNKGVRTELKRRSRVALEAARAGDDPDEATRMAIKRIDKAAAKGIIHKNQANRRKSRLVRAVYEDR